MSCGIRAGKRVSHKGTIGTFARSL
jgi:hypothetical protein